MVVDTVKHKGGLQPPDLLPFCRSFYRLARSPADTIYMNILVSERCIPCLSPTHTAVKQNPTLPDLMLTFKATAQLFILDARGVWESCRWVQLPTSWPTSSPSSTACRASPSSWCTASLASRFGNNMGNGSKGSGNPKLSLRLSRFPAGPCLMTPNPSRYDHALLPEYFTN
nr:uncharacterized protein LOC106829108 isoform X3 [Equus asinus]